jgi:hypothetical protein
MRFKQGDKVRIEIEISGPIWEVIECINYDEIKTASSEDKLLRRITPRYKCKCIDHYGKEIINNILETSLKPSE